jgi:gamma-glutamyl:cysteine ligase YbdK (ATP-grasp superfamily)
MRSSAVVTMGVEEEFLLVDSGTGAVVPRAGEVLDLAAASGMDLQGELTQTQVETVEVSNRIRPWLPVLLAMAANSPYWRGKDTGYASWRSILWSRWPPVRGLVATALDDLGRYEPAPAIPR